MIATLGSYAFTVSSEQVKTFTDLRVSEGANYAEHKVLGRKGLIEFTGLNASTASLNITLTANVGVNPSAEITALRALMIEHEELVFTLGGQVMGAGLWVIESLDSDLKRIDNQGNVLEATVSLKLRESVIYD